MEMALLWGLGDQKNKMIDKLGLIKDANKETPHIAALEYLIPLALGICSRLILIFKTIYGRTCAVEFSQ